jgi:hypothetical protein
MRDRKMHNLSCSHLQFDEIWGIVPVDSPEAAVRASIVRDYKLAEEI